MAGKDTRISEPRSLNPVPFFKVGSETSEALVSAQKVLFESYEESMRAWFDRMQTEASLWSELPARMAGSESVAKAMEAYSDCVSQQVQMSVEDGQQLLENYRRIARKVVNSFGGDESLTGTNSDLPSCL